LAPTLLTLLPRFSMKWLHSRPSFPNQHPTVLQVEGLTRRAFWSPTDFTWAIAVADVAPLALQEWTDLESHSSELQQGWSTLPLLEDGCWHANAQHCPQTVRALQHAPLGMGSALCQAYFSLLKPGTRIAAHSGASNVKLRGQLVLMTGAERGADGMQVGGLCVAGETRLWAQGELLIFDDSLEHSVHLPASAAPRLVLVFDFWHPDLSDRIRRDVLAAFPSRFSLNDTAVREVTRTTLPSLLRTSESTRQGVISWLKAQDAGRLFAASRVLQQEDSLWRPLCLRDAPPPWQLSVNDPRERADRKPWRDMYYRYFQELVLIGREGPTAAEWQGRTAKVILVGDAGVGKTTFLSVAKGEPFTEAYVVSSIGVDFKIMSARVRGEWIKLQVWDTAGPERFRTITRAYYRTAGAVLLCFDLTHESSFRSLERYLQEARDASAPGTAFVVAGLKADLLEESQLSAGGRPSVQGSSSLLQAARVWASSEGISFVEVSSKTGFNVDHILQVMLKQVKNFATVAPRMKQELPKPNARQCLVQ